MDFLHIRQFEVQATISEVADLIKNFEKHNLRQTTDILDFETLSFQGFSTFLTSKINSPLDPGKTSRVYQDMTYPLK